MNLQKQLETLEREIQKVSSKKEIHEKAFADVVNKLERLKIERQSVLDEINRERNTAMIHVAETHGINTADALALVLEKRGVIVPISEPESPVNTITSATYQTGSGNEEDGD